LLDAIESLQGAALPASALEAAILPARIAEYDPSDLDTLAAAGEIVWVGVESLGQRDGRVGLYLTDRLPVLGPAPAPGAEARLDGRERAVLEVLRQRGASFFGPLHEAVGGGYAGETVAVLWALVWQGLITNDSFQALRRYLHPPARAHGDRPTGRPFRSRRECPPSSEGRWSALRPAGMRPLAATDRAAALADQLLSRYGILTRDAAALENVPGGFTAIYAVLRALEDAGRVRRGYFVGGVAATQFARPSAIELLRAARTPGAHAEVHALAATDPANPYGHLLPWPSALDEGDGVLPSCARAANATVVLVDGTLAAFWRNRSTDVGVCLPAHEPERSRTATGLARELARLAVDEEGHPRGLLITTVNGRPADTHPVAPFLQRAGFRRSAMGYHVVRPGQRPTPATSNRQDGTEEGLC
jgi:ATP-dependent Lhr-like helicase